MSDQANLGVRIDATENLSQVAQKSTSALDQVIRKAGEAKKALGIEDLQEQYNKLNQDIKEIGAGLEKARGAGGGPKGGPAAVHDRPKQETNEEKESRRQQTNFLAESNKLLRGLGSTFANLGRTGDIAGAAIGATDTAAGFLQSMPAAAKVAGAITAVVAGSAMVLNKLSEQYEAVMQDSMSVAAALGGLGKSAAENSLLFKESMSRASQSAAEFGYTLKEGNLVFKGLIQAGGKPSDVDAMSRNLFGYTRGMNVDMALGSRALGMGQLFGLGGNPLALAAGGAQATGMGTGRTNEYLQAMVQIVEAGMERGVTAGFTKVSETQNWIAQLGPLYQGARGAQFINQLTQSVAGATALSKDTDVIMFQAAQSLTKGGNYIDVMKRMEQTIDKEMFTAIRDKIRSYAGKDEASRIEMLRQTFGVNYTTAERLNILNSEAAVKELTAPNVQDTPEVKLLTIQEDIRERIREIGSGLTGAKAAIETGLGTVIELLAKGLKVDLPGIRNKMYADQYADVQAQAAKNLRGSTLPIVEDYLGRAMSTGLGQGYTDPAMGSAAAAMTTGLASMSPAELKAFQGKGMAYKLSDAFRRKDFSLGMIQTIDRAIRDVKVDSLGLTGPVGTFLGMDNGDIASDIEILNMLSNVKPGGRASAMSALYAKGTSPTSAGGARLVEGDLADLIVELRRWMVANKELVINLNMDGQGDAAGTAK
jgi:hypothetical protein